MCLSLTVLSHDDTHDDDPCDDPNPPPECDDCDDECPPNTCCKTECEQLESNDPVRLFNGKFVHKKSYLEMGGPRGRGQSGDGVSP